MPVQRLGKPLPRAHEEALARALAPMVAQAQATAANVRTVGDAEAFGRAMRRAWSDERLRGLVAAAGVDVEREASRPFATLAKRLDVAPDVRMDASPHELVDAWAKDATAKISSVRDDAVAGMRRDIVKALERGTDPATLAAKWKRDGIPLQWGTLEGRVKVIAQHQLTSLHAHVAATRAQALGIKEFVWRSQGDSRVRPHHRNLDGTKHAYARPPAEGLPGQPVNCRCFAESVIDADTLRKRGPKVGRASGAAAADPLAKLGVNRAQVEALTGFGDVPVEITKEGKSININAKLPGGGKVARSLERRRGKLVLHAELLELPKVAQGSGTGTKAFVRMVEAAEAMGVDIIETTASGHAASKNSGYAVWPKLGYNGPIIGQAYEGPIARAKAAGAAVHPDFRKGAMISELYKTPEGREWWRLYGNSIDLTFDPKPGSESRRRLAAYLASKK